MILLGRAGEPPGPGSGAAQRLIRPDDVPRSPIPCASFAFAVFSFVTTSGAFHAAGLEAPALGALYALVLLLAARACLLPTGAGRRSGVRPAALLPALGFPAVALLSVLWSEDPMSSLRYAIQLGVTAGAGLAIGSILGLAHTLRALGVAMALVLGASVANLALELVPAWSRDDYVGAPTFLVGVFDQKNSFGHVAALGAWCALLAGLLRGAGPMLGAIGVAAGAGALILASGSGTALVLYTGACAMPPIVHLARRRPAPSTALLTCATLVACAAFACALAGLSPIDALLGALGKDATLTGRGAMWAIAIEQIRASPLLGVGYQVWWHDPAFAPSVSLVRATVLESIGNFHNAVLEAAVGTGLPGALALVALPAGVVVLGLGALAGAADPAGARTDASRTHLAGAVVLALLIGVRSLVEASLAFQHQLDFLLLAALTGALAARPVRLPAASPSAPESPAACAASS